MQELFLRHNADDDRALTKKGQKTKIERDWKSKFLILLPLLLKNLSEAFFVLFTQSGPRL